MKKSKALICILLALITVIGSVISTSGYRAEYELSNGAAVFNSSAAHRYFVKSNSVNNLDMSYDSAQNAEAMRVNTASDPYALLSYDALGVTLSAATYKYIVITYKVPQSVSTVASESEIFYCAGATSVPTGGKSKSFTLTKDNAFHAHIIEMTAVSEWTGTIHALRIDCFKNASVGDVMYLDSVILAKTSSEANQIAAYRTAKANVTLDDVTVQTVFTSDNYSKYLVTGNGTQSLLLGDINLDKIVSSGDFILMKKYLACAPLTDTYDLDAADMDRDGRISVKDSLLLKKALLGFIDLNPDSTASALVSFDTQKSKAALRALSSTPSVYMTYEPVTNDTYGAGQFKYLTITYMTTKAGNATVYGITDRTDESSAKAYSFTLNADGKYHSATLSFANESLWTGTIKKFKLNFLANATSGDVMYLDSVTLTENMNLATVGGDYREAIANGYSFDTSYKLDITGQTLGQINTSGTYNNVGDGSTVLYPFSASWPAAGYPDGGQDTLIVFKNYNNYIKIADCVDLSKYDSVTVSCGTDKSFTTTASTFGFFSKATIFGQTGTKNTANLIFDVPLSVADSSKPSWTTLRDASATVNSNYCGPLYMSYYMSTGDGAVVTDITFHLKTPTADIPDTLNNSDGDTVYTVSKDGTTISANGVSYPNSINYTNGVTAATDDVNRTLTLSDATKLNGGSGGYDFANKNVGIFYFLWLGAHGTALPSGGGDIQKIVNTHGAIAGSDSRWLGNGTIHYFFSEPLYGYYKSTDEWVIRKHIEELTNADIDFLYFDVTNGVPYIDTAKKVMQIIHEFNEMGYNPPKVVFYSNDSKGEYTNGKTMVQYLYDTIYAPGYLPDTWFYYLGKPVIIGKKSEYTAMSQTAQNFFTFRQSQWPNETKTSDSTGYMSGNIYKKDGGWSWMDFNDLPTANRNPAGTAYESINVSIAQHLGTIAFGDSGIYGYNTVPTSMGGKFRLSRTMNHGRNWNGSYNNDAGGYSAGNCAEGTNFQRQWNTLHNTYNDNLSVVLITGWNEWAAGKIDTTNTIRDKNYSGGYDMAWFVDTATVNYSRDAEMTKGYYFDSYYMQIINNIRQYKGASPVLVRNQKKRIDIYGSFDQWNSITTSYRDAMGETAARNAVGFGDITYRNTTGRNDIQNAKVVCDTEYIYFYADCAQNITPYSTASSWMQLFIDSDNSSSTGWYGYDYIVNYKAQGSDMTSVAKNTANGSYSFEITNSEIEYKTCGNMIMIKVPLSELGITDYSNITFSFKWGDSTGNLDTMEKMFTDGDVMPLGRLNHLFTNVGLN